MKVTEVSLIFLLAASVAQAIQRNQDHDHNHFDRDASVSTSIYSTVTASPATNSTTAPPAKLPKKPSPAPGAQKPDDIIPFTSSVNSPFDPFTGMTYKSMTLATDTLFKSFHLAAMAANTSDSEGVAIWALTAAVRYYSWYPLTNANFMFDVRNLFNNIVVLSFQNFGATLRSTNITQMVSLVDWVGKFDYDLNVQPGSAKIVDLGLFIRSTLPGVLGVRYFFPLDQYTADMDTSLTQSLRYNGIQNWHATDLYARGCLVKHETRDLARARDRG